MRHVKSASSVLRCTLQLLVVGWMFGVSIPSSPAVDDFEAVKQRWEVALTELRSPWIEPHDYKTYEPILQIATYCPHHPELIDTLFSVLNDETRREDWDQAIGCVSTAVHGGLHLSKSHVDQLTKILPHVVEYHRDSYIGLLGMQKEYADIALSAVRPYLAHDKATMNTVAAAAVLRLDPTDQEAQKVLLTVATSVTIKDRRCAVRRMGRSGVDTPQFRDALRVGMKDSDSGVRVLSACSLWEITKSAEESLPVMKASLTDEIVQIDLNMVMYPSRTYPSQHLSTINCLVEMAITEPGAKQLLEDIAMKKVTVEDEWAVVSQSLIGSYGRMKYPGTGFQEAAIRMALADDGVFSELARKRFSKLTTVQLEAYLELFAAFRKQEALWSEGQLHQ